MTQAGPRPLPRAGGPPPGDKGTARRTSVLPTPARLAGIDPIGDIALLQTPLAGTAPARLREDVAPGEQVEHHGFPVAAGAPGAVPLPTGESRRTAVRVVCQGPAATPRR